MEDREREAEYSFMMGSKCASLSAAVAGASVARLDTRDVRPFERRCPLRLRMSLPFRAGPDRGEPESGVSPFQSKAAAVNRRLDQTTKWIEAAAAACHLLGRKELDRDKVRF